MAGALIDLTPALVLAMWVAGIAAGGAVVAYLKIVGVGYTWVVAGVVALFAGLTGVLDGGIAAWAALALAALAAITARFSLVSSTAFALAGMAMVVAAPVGWSTVSILSGALILGGVTSEMLLGHWFLIDPTLPRWSLRALAGAGGAGVLADVGYVAIVTGLDFSELDRIFLVGYLLLVVMTGLLVIGVWFSLNEPRYSGVMAATGLSYLAVLTAFGVVVIGRMVVVGGAGSVPIS